MDNELLDENVQRKLALASFFGGAGMKIFRRELDQLLLGADDHIRSLLKDNVNESKLSELNFKLGKKEAFQIVLFVLEELEQELQER